MKMMAKMFEPLSDKELNQFLTLQKKMSDHLNSYAYASKSNYSPRKTSAPPSVFSILGNTCDDRRPCCSCHRRKRAHAFFAETHFGRD